MLLCRVDRYLRYEHTSYIPKLGQVKYKTDLGSFNRYLTLQSITYLYHDQPYRLDLAGSEDPRLTLAPNLVCRWVNEHDTQLILQTRYSILGHVHVFWQSKNRLSFSPGSHFVTICCAICAACSRCNNGLQAAHTAHYDQPNTTQQNTFVPTYSWNLFAAQPRTAIL